MQVQHPFTPLFPPLFPRTKPTCSPSWECSASSRSGSALPSETATSPPSSIPPCPWKGLKALQQPPLPLSLPLLWPPEPSQCCSGLQDSGAGRVDLMILSDQEEGRGGGGGIPMPPPPPLRLWDSLQSVNISHSTPLPVGLPHCISSWLWGGAVALRNRMEGRRGASLCPCYPPRLAPWCFV